MSKLSKQLECKNCGLLKSTILATDHTCLKGYEHEYLRTEEIDRLKKECTCNLKGAETDIGHFEGCPLFPKLEIDQRDQTYPLPKEIKDL
jgi:hypothetical protein